MTHNRRRILALVSTAGLAACDISNLLNPLTPAESAAVGTYDLIAWKGGAIPRTFPDSGDLTCLGILTGVFADTISSGTLTLDGYGGFSISLTVHGGRLQYVQGGYTHDPLVWQTCHEGGGVWRVEFGALQLGINQGMGFGASPPTQWTTIMTMPSSGKLSPGTTVEYEGKIFARR